ncbi:unnamed protein product, partial [Protopolystoma xenopodis]
MSSYSPKFGPLVPAGLVGFIGGALPFPLPPPGPGPGADPDPFPGFAAGAGPGLPPLF